MSESATDTGFTIEPATIDQADGALALSLGALGSLLLVIWQSRCLCKCRIGVNDQCYLFDCSREPPPQAFRNRRGIGDRRIEANYGP